MTDTQEEVPIVFDRRRVAERPITPNEAEWINFIRLASGDTDPAPTLNRVQRLQQIFRLSSR